MVKYKIEPLGYADNIHYIEGSSCLDAINNFDRWLRETRYWYIVDATQVSNHVWKITVKGLGEKSMGFAIYKITARCEK